EFAGGIRDGDGGPGGEQDGSKEVGRRRQQQGEPNARSRRALPASAVLAAASGLFTGKDGDSNIRRVVCQVGGDVIRTAYRIVDEDAAADGAGGAMPNCGWR